MMMTAKREPKTDNREPSITDFERKVYEAVRRIPKGEVRSYAQVAKAIGHPRAYRAVGNALNKNPFVGIVPCHRVIRSNGTLGGFSRGRKAKRQMLEKEGLRVKDTMDCGLWTMDLPVKR